MLWKIAYANRSQAERRQADGALDQASIRESQKTVMNKRSNLEKAADDAMEHVVAAVEDVKAGATAMVDGLGRATQKKLRDVQGATETALAEAGSKATNLRSRGVAYVHRHPLNTVVTTFGAILLVSLIFFLMRHSAKEG
jgi:hypothetical protein